MEKPYLKKQSYFELKWTKLHRKFKKLRKNSSDVINIFSRFGSNLSPNPELSSF